MDDQGNPVTLQSADRRNLPPRFADIKVGGHEKFSNANSAVVCLRLHREILTNDRVYQIVDSAGTVVMDDAMIWDEIGKRT